eukprot:UN33015
MELARRLSLGEQIDEINMPVDDKKMYSDLKETRKKEQNDMELARRLSLGQQIDEINPHSLFMKQNKMDGDLKRALEESMKPQENPNVLKAIEASLKPEGS